MLDRKILALLLWYSLLSDIYDLSDLPIVQLLPISIIFIGIIFWGSDGSDGSDDDSNLLIATRNKIYFVLGILWFLY